MGTLVSALWGCVLMAPKSFRSGPPPLGGLTLPCSKGNDGFQEPAVTF